MSTWANMPGWDYKLWDNSTLNRKNFPITWPYILKAMQEGKKLGDVKKRFAQVGDLMRLEILYRHGGIYLDANIERIKDIGPLFRSPKVQMAVSNENPCGFQCYGDRGMRYVSNSFIASTPKNPNLKLMLNKKTLDKINFKNKHVNEETGPYFLGRHLFKENGVTMIPTPLVYPFDPDSSGKCFSKGKSLRGANIVLKQPGGSKTYMQFPCKAYPNAYAMKSWQSGGSWW
jgi:hypothetical protein